jgi:hypothetical protein
MNRLYGSITFLLFYFIGLWLVAGNLNHLYAYILNPIKDEILLYLILAGMMIISFTISVSLIFARNPAMHKFFGSGTSIINKESLTCYVFYLVGGCFLGLAYINFFYFFTSIIINNL